jgi:excisionase family DNA binding protein
VARAEGRIFNQGTEGTAAHFGEGDAAFNGRFLKPEEFAKYLGISLRWIYRHIKDIPHHRVGKYLRFDLESPALRHWIESLEQRPQQ